MVALRVIAKTEQADDVREAIAYVKQLKTYPLAAANSPPEQRYIDMAGTLWDGIVRFDEGFYSSLARMVNEELAQARDLEMLGLLRPLGIEKGKRFKPDAATRAVLKQAGHEVHAWFMERLVNYGQRYWPDRKWDHPVAPDRLRNGIHMGGCRLLRRRCAQHRLLQLLMRRRRRRRPPPFLLDTFLDAKGQRAARREHLPTACARQRARQTILGFHRLR